MLKSLMFGAALLGSLGAAQAAVVDIAEAPTGFFVPDDALKYDSPYYRAFGQDWGWTHNTIGGVITDATLQISAFDVDFDSGEIDEIWAFTDFALGANFFDDIATGLEVMIKIDTGTQGAWLVTLAKSALQVNGRVVVNPTPTPTPEPASLALLGLGLAGLAAARRKKA